jgi:hypothetical protein
MPAERMLSAIITQSVTAIWLFTAIAGCTKKSSGGASSPAPVAGTAAPVIPAQPPQSGDGNGGTLERIFTYSLISSAGDVVFCQNFSTKAQVPTADIQSVADSMAMAQAQVPAGVLNPFSPKILGLSVKPEACVRTSALIKDGHCAVTASADTATGKVIINTQQRLLWKDLIILGQANYNQSVIDQKNSAISGKNTLFENVKKQIAQQQAFLNVLQIGQQVTTGQQSEFVKEAQEMLTNLQKQSADIQSEIKRMEDELIPVQDELKKSLEKLTEARDTLKQACTPAGMGATTAEWTAN